MTENPDPRGRRGAGEGFFAGGGALAGLAALISASCCVLPILLVNAGLSAALVANLAGLARIRPYLLAATGLAIAVGFFLAYRGGRRPRPLALAALIMASAMAAASLAAPYFEGDLLRWLDLR